MTTVNTEVEKDFDVKLTFHSVKNRLPNVGEVAVVRLVNGDVWMARWNKGVSENKKTGEKKDVIGWWLIEGYRSSDGNEKQAVTHWAKF